MLEKYTGSDYTLELKKDSKPFPIPNIQETTQKREVNSLIKIGVLKKLIIPNGQLLLLLYLR